MTPTSLRKMAEQLDAAKKGGRYIIRGPDFASALLDAARQIEGLGEECRIARLLLASCTQAELQAYERVCKATDAHAATQPTAPPPP